MKRIAMMMAVLAVALTVGIFAGVREPSQAQDETPELGDIFFVNPSVCLALTINLSCQNGTSTSTLSLDRQSVLVAFDENSNGEVTREEVNRFNRSGNHLHQEDGGVMIVVFVDDDEPVRFDTDKGKLRVQVGVDASDFLCSGDPGFPFGDRMTADEDCDGDGVSGDGILFAQLLGAGADLGPGELRVSDEGDGAEIGIFEFLVVGEPQDIVAAPFETVLAAGIDPDDPEGCELPTTVAGFTEALGNANKAVVIARAEDINGSTVIGAWTGWSVEPKDKDKVAFGAPETPTLDLGGFGFGAPQVICGLEGAGEIEVTIKFLAGPIGTNSFDPAARPDNVKFTINLVDVPADITFTVTPATLNCDGLAGAEVAATVTTADGDPVANGTEVRFNVAVLGIAAPIRSTTVDGVAKTIVTPLALQNTGVPVIASVGPEEVRRFPGGVDDGTTQPNPNYVERSTIVNCGAGSGAPGTTPPPPPAPPATGGGASGGQTGVIRGPDTGSGGLADGRDGMSAWPVVALFVGAMALAGARYGLRRS